MRTDWAVLKISFSALPTKLRTDKTWLKHTSYLYGTNSIQERSSLALYNSVRYSVDVSSVANTPRQRLTYSDSPTQNAEIYRDGTAMSFLFKGQHTE